MRAAAVLGILCLFLLAPLSAAPRAQDPNVEAERLMQQASALAAQADAAGSAMAALPLYREARAKLQQIIVQFPSSRAAVQLVLDDTLARRLDAAIAETQALAKEERAQAQAAERRCKQMPTPPCLIDRATSVLPEITAEPARSTAVGEVMDAQLRLGNLDAAHAVIARLAPSLIEDAAVALWSKLAQAAVAVGRSDIAQAAVSEAAAIVARLSSHPGTRFHALSAMADAQIAIGDRSGAASSLTDLRSAMRQLSDVPMDDYVELAAKQIRVGDDAGAGATVLVLDPSNHDSVRSGIAVELAERGRIDDARMSAAEITEPSDRARALIAIAAALEASGRTQEAASVLNEAGQLVRELQYPHQQSKLLKKHLPLDAALRPDRAKSLLTEVVASARTGLPYPGVLGEFALLHEDLGDGAAARALVVELLDRTAELTGEPWAQQQHYSRAYEVAEKIGARDLALQALERWKALLVEEKPGGKPVEDLMQIAIAEQRLGSPAARTTADRALDVARRIKDAGSPSPNFMQDWASRAIAGGQARLGSFEAALATAKSIPDSRERSFALELIALAHAEAGDPVTAAAVAELVPMPEVRVRTLTSVARRLDDLTSEEVARP